jgi:hypothetical protein
LWWLVVRQPAFKSIQILCRQQIQGFSWDDNYLQTFLIFADLFAGDRDLENDLMAGEWVVKSLAKIARSGL